MHIGTLKQIWRYPVKSMAGEMLSNCPVNLRGIPGDRGWALRDETSKEITNGKRLPLLMQCKASYLEQPAENSIPHVEISLVDGRTIRSSDNDVNSMLSNLLKRPVSLWPLQPASNLEHYRRHSKAARVFGRLAKYRSFRSAIPTLASFGKANAELRSMFSREPGEPVPDISLLPPDVLEFTSPPGTYFDAFPVQLLTSASLETMSRQDPTSNWDVRRFRPNFLIETESGIEGLVESEWRGRGLRIGTLELRCEIPTARCGMTMHAQAEFAKEPAILRSIVKYADQNLGTYANVTTAGEVSVGSSVELI